MPNRHRDPATLRAIRLDLEQSCRVFGKTLKRAVDPKAYRGYSHVYILSLESGRRALTPTLERAYDRIAAAHDEADPDTASSRVEEVFSTHNITGCLVTGQARRCIRPGCTVRFVPHHPSQRYHSVWCRERRR